MVLTQVWWWNEWTRKWREEGLYNFRVVSSTGMLCVGGCWSVSVGVVLLVLLFYVGGFGDPDMVFVVVAVV